MPTLCLITARGGSKGLPGKNIKPLGGKPLLAWSVEQARESGVCDRILLSTDSPEIATGPNIDHGHEEILRVIARYRERLNVVGLPVTTFCSSMAISPPLKTP